MDFVTVESSALPSSLYRRLVKRQTAMPLPPLTPASSPRMSDQRVISLLAPAASSTGSGIHKRTAHSSRSRRLDFTALSDRKDSRGGYQHKTETKRNLQTRLTRGLLASCLSIGEEALLNAVQQDDIGRAIGLLREGITSTCRDSNGRTPLHWAASRGNVELMRALIENGAQVNARDTNGNSALHLAVISNHVECVLLLLHAGALVNASDKSCRSPLDMARSRLALLRRLRHMRRKATALPKDEEEDDDNETMEQLTERRNTVKQMEQIINLLRHYICLRRPTVGHRLDAGATAELTVSSLDAITDRLRMVALQSEPDEKAQPAAVTSKALDVDDTNDRSSNATEAETELLINDLQTMLNQFEL
ncbi:ankyrin repeat-containing domain protein [Syncephalis plumigaleata]|nr:ankyrin repeat-containing domain protein [Syncephalis plumigaleata]